MCAHVYVCMCEQLMKREALNLKESKEGYMRVFGKRKENEWERFTYNLKKIEEKVASQIF